MVIDRTEKNPKKKEKKKRNKVKLINLVNDKTKKEWLVTKEKDNNEWL